MAGEKGTKYFNVFLNYKIWLSTYKGDGILGDGKCQLLKTIEKTGSLKAATELLKISYRKAWGNIKNAEELLGFSLVEKQRGGEQGGKTVLTDDGKALVDAYDTLQEEMQEAVGRIAKDFFAKINEKHENRVRKNNSKRKRT